MRECTWGATFERSESAKYVKKTGVNFPNLISIKPKNQTVFYCLTSYFCHQIAGRVGGQINSLFVRLMMSSALSSNRLQCETFSSSNSQFPHSRFYTTTYPFPNSFLTSTLLSTLLSYTQVSIYTSSYTVSCLNHVSQSDFASI